jgi:hypothetical protein
MLVQASICYFPLYPVSPRRRDGLNHPLVVKIFRNPRCRWGNPAFSLVEMAAVIAILLIVMTAGIGLRSGSPAASQRTATDLVAAMADRARTTAIAKRTPVVMALAAPSDLPAGEDGRCRIGLFQVTSENRELPEIVRTVTALGRWKPIERGTSWTAGMIEGAVNPRDSPRLTLHTAQGSLRVHGIIFNARGGLVSPPGSAPAVICIGATGGRAADTIVPETRLRVGRVTGRIYHQDP